MQPEECRCCSYGVVPGLGGGLVAGGIRDWVGDAECADFCADVGAVVGGSAGSVSAGCGDIAGNVAIMVVAGGDIVQNVDCAVFNVAGGG